ncbi:MAG: fused MFS/spermidine synthase [Labilithrix sp.]|nr:fused MFS/spermidine synthase [Labilithrix sp.]
MSRHHVVLGCLVAATGASALIVEQAFEKLLSTVVGSSAEAGALVLSCTFAGLSLGGVGYGRFAHRARTPLGVYVGVEALVGVAALALAIGLAGAQSLAARLVVAAGDHRSLVFATRLIVASLWILPPTIAMGASYPAVVGVLERLAGERREAVPRSMARFYALNVMGAALGAFGGPYLLFPRFGIDGALLAVAGSQALVVIAGLVIARDFPRRLGAPVAPRASRAPLPRLLAALAVGSGFLVFGLEVLWLHLIGAVLGMAVYAFAILLTVVLLGLFAGGVLASRERHRPWVLPGTLLLSSVAVLTTGALWDRAPRWILILGKDVDSFAGGEVVRFAIAGVLVGVPSVCLGTIYPSLFRSPAFPRSEGDRHAGRLGALNAVGSVAGALVTGFVLIPSIGSERTSRLLGALPSLFALALARRSLPWAGRPATTLVLVLAALFTFGLAAFLPPWNRLDLTAGTNVYFTRGFVTESTRLLRFTEDFAGGFTTVVASGRTKTLLTNGKFQGNDAGEVIEQIAFGLVPAALVTGRDRALVIGLGTGQTARVVAAAGFGSIDIAEISPGIREAARHEFALTNDGIVDDPRVFFHLEDGRNFLLRSRTRYDLVTIETTSVWFAGASNLYSREMYRLIREHLRPGGVLQQWVQFHHLSPDDVQGILATLRAELPHVTLWRLGSQGCMVASDAPIAIRPEAVAQLEASSEMAELLSIVERRRGITLKALGDRLLLDGTAVDRLAEDAATRGLRLTTDGNRHVEYSTPRHNLEKTRHADRVMDRLLESVDPAQREATRARFR